MKNIEIEEVEVYESAVIHIGKLKGIIAVAEASCDGYVKISDMSSCLASCVDIAEMLTDEINSLAKIFYTPKA